jgi:hypothetical protein
MNAPRTVCDAGGCVATKPVADALLQEAIDALAEYGNKAEAARALNLPPATYDNRIRHAQAKGFEPCRRDPEFEVDHPNAPVRSATELIAWRKDQFQRKAKFETERRLIPVRIKIDGPIGIVHMGDPHVDDDGTDLGLLESHVAIVNRTPGMFGANIGDPNNNWVGRLAHLYGQQSVTAKESWVLVEWLVKALRWVYLLGGNHGAWSGEGDPLAWLTRQQGVLYDQDGARVVLKFPNGREVRTNARHDWPGRSQYNPAHGQTKAAMFGFRDHIVIAGHEREQSDDAPPSHQPPGRANGRSPAPACSVAFVAGTRGRF